MTGRRPGRVTARLRSAMRPRRTARSAPTVRAPPRPSVRTGSGRSGRFRSGQGHPLPGIRRNLARLSSPQQMPCPLPPVPKGPADCEYEPPTAQLQTDLRVSIPARPRPRNRFWACDADPAYSGGDGSWRSGSGGTPVWVGSDATGVEVDCSGVASCQGQRSNFGIKP